MTTFWTSAVLPILCLVMLSTGKIPDGYILQVKPMCGESVDDTASIHIITDLTGEARGACAHNRTVNFITTDGVNFYLPVSYPGEGSLPCVFWKRQNSLVFTLTVVFYYGEEGSMVHQQEEEFQITCTFDDKGSDDSSNSDIQEGLIAPGELKTNMGTDSLSTFTVELVNVLGQTLDGSSLALGRRVQLRGTMQGEGNEMGLRPVSCYAVDKDAEYAILRAGCGDGIIFGKDEGFTTTGNTTLSPYFSVFSLNGGKIIKFKCDFITCVFACDGNSCATSETELSTEMTSSPPTAGTSAPDVV